MYLNKDNIHFSNSLDLLSNTSFSLHILIQKKKCDVNCHFHPFLKILFIYKVECEAYRGKELCSVSLSYCIAEKRFKLKFSDSKVLIPEIMP